MLRLITGINTTNNDTIDNGCGSDVMILAMMMIVPLAMVKEVTIII